jgi:hypothetical protein
VAEDARTAARMAVGFTLMVGGETDEGEGEVGSVYAEG